MKRIIAILSVMVLLCSSSFTQPDAKTFFENGLASLNKQQYIQAIGEFTNAISLNPKYADAYYHRAYAKDLLGKKMGFFSAEMCSDLVLAMTYGKTEAGAKLEKSCMNECYGIDNAFDEPEVVYCADFSSKILADFPAGSEKLQYMVKLNMFNNKLTSINDRIGTLNKLITLDLSSNKITSVSAEIGKLTYLIDLNLQKNLITTLPTEFGNLKNVKTLNLRMNQLTSVPRSVSMLTSLVTLDLALNKLTSLPLEIANLKNLKTLILVGNEIPPAQQQIIKKMLPNTTIYFE